MIDHRILFPYAYNILGSAEDARDVIQDVLSDYVAGHREGIEDEKNYLIRSVINRAINAKKRKRKVIGQSDIWLPEPVATDDAADRNLYLKDILSYSLMVLLEKLNATDRDTQTSVLLERYMDAIRRRDTLQLESLLSAEVVHYADGGGKIQVVKKVSTGVAEVAALLIMAYHRFQAHLTIRPTRVNHQAAFAFYNGDQLVVCQVFHIDKDGKIFQVSSILDPEKLRNHLTWPAL